MRLFCTALHFKCHFRHSKKLIYSDQTASGQISRAFDLYVVPMCTITISQLIGKCPVHNQQKGDKSHRHTFTVKFLLQNNCLLDSRIEPFQATRDSLYIIFYTTEATITMVAKSHRLLAYLMYL